jgi:hypothetical protein
VISALVHRCTVWQPTSTPTDEYGQPAPAGFAVVATDVRCRMSPPGAEAPTLWLEATVAITEGDRVSAVQDPSGNTIDSGPFAVQEVVSVIGRAVTSHQRLQLRRLTSIDQA